MRRWAGGRAGLGWAGLGFPDGGPFPLPLNPLPGMILPSLSIVCRVAYIYVKLLSEQLATRRKSLLSYLGISKKFTNTV